MGRLRHTTGIALLCLTACSGREAPVAAERIDALTYALTWAGPKRAELQKALDHYARPSDRLKRRAVAYLIGGLPYQVYTETPDTAALARILAQAENLSSTVARVAYLRSCLGALAKRSPATIKQDVDVIDAPYLIDNVELAFAAWQRPWARSLSFADFCRYVLPYKSPGEKPGRTRRVFAQRYTPGCDTVHVPTSRRAVCAAVCQRLNAEYRFSEAMPALGTAATARCKVGTCFTLTQLTGEVMRAVGLPVTHEACTWGNYDGGHAWNALYENCQFVPFAFTDAPPGTGDFKCEMTVAEANDHWRRRRAKVWRNQYLPSAADQAADQPLQEDVTAAVLPCSAVTLTLPAVVPADGPVYLCTFSNRTWAPVSQGRPTGAQFLFSQMGRSVCYLPAQISALRGLIPVGSPFVLNQDGRIVPVAGRARAHAMAHFTAKFPIGGNNKIKIGDAYRLVCWRDGWQPLGEQTATAHALQFANVPPDALLWLQDVDRGTEERIFTYENGRQVWW